MKTVLMVRNDDGKTADVHPDEVENWRRAGWATVKPARAESDLEARESSPGWFHVYKGDAKIQGVGAMRAEDAAAFNTMTPSERAAHVAGEIEG